MRKSDFQKGFGPWAVVTGGLRALERNKPFHIPGLMNRLMLIRWVGGC